MNKYFHVTSRVREEKKTNAHGFENTERERESKRIFTFAQRMLTLVGKKVKKNGLL